MSLFGGNKKTYVSSVVYNMAGPVEDRPDYLKSVLLGTTLTDKKQRISDVVVKTYQSGTGIRLRSYHRWARQNYKQVGIPTDKFFGKPTFNAEAVAAAMLDTFGITAKIDWIDSGGPQIEMWGRQWLRENLPVKEPTNTWTVDFIEDTREGLINFTDGTAPIVFTPLGYRTDGEWLYVSYSRPKTTNRWTEPLLFIYQKGTGSTALDAMFQTNLSVGEYLPFIPLRHENKFISSTYMPLLYEEAVDAYKRSVGGKFSDLIANINTNPSVGDIDFAYVVFGVPFNTKDMASRRYMFQFFKRLKANQSNTTGDMNTWLGSQATTAAGIVAWKAWLASQQTNPAGDPISGTQPSRPVVTDPPANFIVIEDNGVGRTNLKMVVTWNDIQSVTTNGLGKAGAKTGEVWFTFVGSQTITASAYSTDEVENLQIDTIEAYWQKSATQYEKLTIRGMQHLNYIYDGKYVTITAAQALVDDDESGFIIPLQYDLFREMSLVDATQMSSQCMNIVFNCYQVVKQKWYQTGFFKIVLIAAVVLISIFYPPAAAFFMQGGGILGASATVGAALGFTGLAAVIAGTVANLVAAMILTKLITVVSVEILGEKIGYIVAAIASFAAIGLGSSLSQGGSLAASWSTLMEPINLLNLTSSVGNAYAQAINTNTMEIVDKTKDALDDYRKQSLELQENYAEQFGYGTAVFDPMRLTETVESFFVEPSETFLSRTLLTGSEIAQMGSDMISNFVELTLQNEFKE